MGVSDIASSCPVLRSRRPQTRLEASCTRTGRPRRLLLLPSSSTAGEGLGHKARMNVSEESDSGIVPVDLMTIYGDDDIAKARAALPQLSFGQVHLKNGRGSKGLGPRTEAGRALRRAVLFRLQDGSVTLPGSR